MRHLLVALVLPLAGCGLVAGSSSPSKESLDVLNEVPPRAVCGPGSVEEEDLQGQVSTARRQAGFTGYSCNLQLVGQWPGEGASWQHDWYGDCSYYGTRDDPAQQHHGTVVVDARDTSKPVASDYLADEALVDPWESLKAHQGRALLGAFRGDSGSEQGTDGGPEFSIYDLQGDCTHPRLLSTTAFEGHSGHEGTFNQDGTIYYGAGPVAAVDVTDPAIPQLIGSFSQSQHGLSFSKDGNRAYTVHFADSEKLTGGNGMYILDTSEFQARKPNPQASVVGSISWEDGLLAQHTVPVTYQGKPFIIFVDEGGYGAARIIDIQDETAPKVISKLKLEIHLPENRAEAQRDGSTGIVNYDGHYCRVDRLDDPTIVACAYIWSGIRVFDIRDPYQPKEIAYWVPPQMTSGAGSQRPDSVDSCTSQIRVVPERGELWTTCFNNGFVILKFTNGAWPFKPT